MNKIKAIQLIGNKNSGKTTLAIQLTEIFKQKGLKVGCIKYTHHCLDRIDSDTDKLSKNAHIVVGISKDSSEIIFDHRKKFLDTISYLDVDILIIEGGKHEIDFLPKIVLGNSQEEIDKLKDELTISVYSRFYKEQGTKEELLKLAQLILDKGFFLPGINCQMCGENSCREMGIKILKDQARPSDCSTLHRGKVKVEIDGKPMSLNPFLNDIISSTIYGLLSPLKGFHKGEIKIKIKG